MEFSGGAGSSVQQFRAEWAVLKESRNYEFKLGEYVLPAIAHCTRKDILIFNANVHGAMDPIYVVKASTLGGRQASTTVPVILAYNSVHYEGLVPNSEDDLIKTIQLKEQYLNNKYTLKKKDIPIFTTLIKKNAERDTINISVNQSYSFAAASKSQGTANPGDKANLKEVIKEAHQKETKAKKNSPPPKKRKSAQDMNGVETEKKCFLSLEELKKIKQKDRTNAQKNKYSELMRVQKMNTKTTSEKE